MSEVWLLVLLAGLITYATRVAGHLVLRRLDAIPPRLDAALNAVPPAMLVTIVTPVFVEGGWLERLVIAGSGLLSLRLSVLSSVVVGTAAMALLRAAGFG